MPPHRQAHIYQFFMPGLNQNVGQYLRESIRTPDGFTALILSAIFLIVALIPEGLSTLGLVFGFAIKPGLTSLHLLSVPIMLFVGYVSLNAFTETSRAGAYANTILLVIFAALLFRGSVTFS